MQQQLQMQSGNVVTFQKRAFKNDSPLSYLNYTLTIFSFNIFFLHVRKSSMILFKKRKAVHYDAAPETN